MNLKDLFTHLLPTRAVAPGTYTTTPSSTVIDLQGYKGALFLIDVGIGGITFTGTNSITFELQDSPDNSTFTDVDITKVIGISDTSLTGGVVKSFTAAKAAASLNAIGYVGGQRYLKLIANFNGTHGTGTFVDVKAILGEAAFQPVQARIAVAN
jgi:hypothetical protein